MSISQRLAELGLTLPQAAAPLANYVPARRSGNLMHLSGHLGKRDGKVVTGRAGEDLGVDELREVARLCALDMLGSAAAALDGDVDRVRGVVKVVGMVRSAPGFGDQPAIVNGASDLFVEVLGDAGRHARAAVGMAELPMGAALEIEAVLEVE